MEKYKSLANFHLNETTFFQKLSEGAKSRLLSSNYTSPVAIACSPPNWIEKILEYSGNLEIKKSLDGIIIGHTFSPGDLIYLTFLREECVETCNLLNKNSGASNMLPNYLTMASRSLEEVNFYHKLSKDGKSYLSYYAGYTTPLAIAYAPEDWIKKMEVYINRPLDVAELVFPSQRGEEMSFSPGDLVYLQILKQECRELFGLEDQTQNLPPLSSII